MGNTALEKSHSKSSNFKLTLICLLLSLGITGVWCGLALVNILGVASYIILGVGAVVFLFSFFLVGKFTR